MGMFVGTAASGRDRDSAFRAWCWASCIALSVRAPVWGAMPHCRRVRSVSTATRMEKNCPRGRPISYSAGFVLATGLLHVSGIVSV